jgi:hypothetical protein
VHAVGVHVGHEEALSVGREARVLRHAVWCCREVELADLLPGSRVDDDHAVGELTAEQHGVAVDGVVHVVDAVTLWERERLDSLPRLWVVEVQPFVGFGDHDRL